MLFLTRRPIEDIRISGEITLTIKTRENQD
jgi:sRNA-binding carbon storage regulator CsrA